MNNSKNFSSKSGRMHFTNKRISIGDNIDAKFCGNSGYNKEYFYKSAKDLNIN